MLLMLRKVQMMIKNPQFYTVIIGTELLNGRRQDSHFEVVNAQLVARGWNQKANFVIKDNPRFLEDVFLLIQSDPDSVMFSFGGIGSTPDDYTRQVAATAFTGQGVVRHKEAEEIIIKRLGQRAFPHPIAMADLPAGAKLVANPVNQMPGFQLSDRFFFVPGFPEMAHPMVIAALDTFYPQNRATYSCNFIVNCSEAALIDIMSVLPDDLSLSCLPSSAGGKYTSEM
ncbi:MAG: competence/damage-inducible protein A [Desulfobulbus sp.]|nr:MAG: competence/damage-inducible protein A [Desulfobulbus sp.]